MRGTYKDLKSKPDVKPLSESIQNKNLLIASFGILSGRHFDILRDDPHFLAIIEKAGFAPYHTRKAR